MVHRVIDVVHLTADTSDALHLDQRMEHSANIAVSGVDKPHFAAMNLRQKKVLALVLL